MMRTEEERHLKYTIEKVDEKRDSILRKIGDNAKDMESMNDYFWDNYAEFDEYGYEMYDNKMAWKSGLNQLEEYRKDLVRYEKMHDSPYFARVDFRYEEEDRPEV